MDKATAFFFSTLSTSEDLMDVSFTFPKYPTTTFNAHKLVLGTWSPVFRAMFYGGFKKESVIELVDIKPEPFKKLLSFLYCQPLNIVDIDEATALYVIADKYDLQFLIEKVEQYFCSTIEVNNCCEVYDKVVSFKLAEAIKKCEELFVNQTKAIIDSEGFLHCSSLTVNKIACSEKVVGVSELDIYNAIKKWITVQGSNLMSILVSKAIQSVRYLSMETGDICKLDLLTLEERIGIIYRKERPNATDMVFPDGFTVISNPRYSTTLPPSRYCRYRDV